jgi:imidazolonepropionase-like amidohydrolase
MIQLQKENNERYYNCIQNAVQKGVKVALGSDFVGWNPSITAREFRYMCEHGKMSTLKSIQAGTSSAAEMLDITNIGYIKQGLLADLVIVTGDPIKDIEVLEKGVVFVMQNGKIIRHD